jgi:dihydroceramide fatty acyl 2-hydroxylase
MCQVEEKRYLWRTVDVARELTVMSQATHPKPQRGTTRMFESDFFEKFSRVHPWTPAVLYLPVVAISAFVASQSHGVAPGRLLLQVFGGYLAWTLFEYWAHRLVFHMPVVGPKTKRIQFLIHGVHHDFPWDEMRLVFPPGASIGLCLVTYAAFRGIFGVEGMYGPFAGFVLGYIIYDELHWYVHAKQPTSRFGRWLRREHFVHHFKEAEAGTRFGVSCPWLDYVFGTQGRAERPSTGGRSAAPGLDVDSTA